MGRPPKDKTNDPKMTSMILRVEERKARIFSSLISLNGTTANAYFRECIDDYIEKYQKMLNMKEIPDDLKD